MKKVLFIVLACVGVIIIFLSLKSKPMKKIEVGDTIPSFTLLDQDGNEVHISKDYGKAMVVYFYPKDDTPGCTKEACKFRDDFEQFNDLGVSVFGISGDSVESHKKFAEKYRLPFQLLADTKNKIRKVFGVPSSFLILPGRVTYVVDNKGVIQYIFNSQFSAEKHIDNALDILRNMES